MYGCMCIQSARQIIYTSAKIKIPTFHHTHTHTHTFSHLARVKASEEKFVKLREVYSKLRNEHIQLLRTEGEGRKKLQVLYSVVSVCVCVSLPPPLSVQTVTKQVEEIQKKMGEEAERVTQLKAELEEATTVYVCLQYNSALYSIYCYHTHACIFCAFSLL